MCLKFLFQFVNDVFADFFYIFVCEGVVHCLIGECVGEVFFVDFYLFIFIYVKELGVV